MTQDRNYVQNGEKTVSTQSERQNDLTVADVMLPLEKTPKTVGCTLLKVALEIMDKHRLGIICISDAGGGLEGIITDGDLRRMLSNVQKPLAALMSDDVIVHAIRSPSTVTGQTFLKHALTIMEKRQIWDLPVVEHGKLVGLLHLHQAVSRILENDR